MIWLMDLLLQAAGAPQVQVQVPSEYSWVTGLLAGGGTSAIMGFIIWHVFSKMIPAFTAALEKQRADAAGETRESRLEFLAALDKVQLYFREDLDKERVERKIGIERIVEALREQNGLLSKLAGNQKTPPHT